VFWEGQLDRLAQHFASTPTTKDQP
jgi:hypothetical protein